MKAHIAAIYGYSDYRAYLKWALSAEQQGRGASVKLAEHLNCQPSFVSQVLSGRSDFSLEHAFRINRFLKHTPEQSQFFMILVQAGKAGSSELKYFFLDQLERMRRENLQVAKVIKKVDLDEANIMRYYSNWNCVAVHLLVSISEYQTAASLRDKLAISERELEDVLTFLEGARLIKTVGQKITTGEQHIHVRRTSPYAFFASQQVRLHALEKLDMRNDKGLHFGTHFTISKKGLAVIRQKVLDFIGELNEEIGAEDPETLCTLVVDLIENG